MSFRGYHKGMKVYDYLADIPDEVMISGEDLVILNPPEELRMRGDGMTLQRQSPADPVTWSVIALFVMKIILVVVVGTVVILALQQIGIIIRGREGKKIDDNLFEGGDGSIWRRDPDTGEWEMVTGPRKDYLLWAIIGIFLIGILIIVWLNWEKLFGSKAGSGETSGNPGSKKKDNPGRPPKKWWDQKYKEVKEGNPDYSEEQIRKTVGNIWHNELSEAKKKEILSRER